MSDIFNQPGYVAIFMCVVWAGFGLIKHVIDRFAPKLNGHGLTKEEHNWLHDIHSMHDPAKIIDLLNQITMTQKEITLILKDLRDRT